ncbi:hypothetical protein COS16_01900 [Candidatus Desantisbacteria bacterium CG02_land_8_20_14_3_00_49_13]|nr:MAG: hypothetical protein COS16_01900 [Candidatus Desantisbacteria bacterium CG02_land_8_20_14_3_00_49_13]PJB28880.1 MAG: hypothetical protein CO111_00410 [Candidatus Desantisbacteria bacterium CG_4_9_14_3_um_filter_50_7]
MIKDGLCAICGGKTREKKVMLDRIWEKKFYLFEETDVLVCQDCGEIWIPGKTAEKMDRIIQEKLKPKKKVLVPVFSL